MAANYIKVYEQCDFIIAFSVATTFASLSVSRGRTSMQ